MPMLPIGPTDDRRGPARKGPAKLTKVKAQANTTKSVKNIKAPKGLSPGDNIRNKKR